MRNYILLAALLLLGSCMTPRQTEAAAVLQELFYEGVLTKEQLDALLAALSPTAWVNDLIAIGSGLFGGGAAYVATNMRRNALRRARGEPVKPVAS